MWPSAPASVRCRRGVGVFATFLLMDDFDVTEGFVALDAARRLLNATYTHDRDGRARICEEISAHSWSEVALLLAASKHVLIEKASPLIERQGREDWISETANKILASHADWVRLRRGQMVAMLRAGLGDHQLATTVSAEVSARADSFVVQTLLERKLDRYDNVPEAIDDLLSDAELLTRRRAFMEDFDRWFASGD